MAKNLIYVDVETSGLHPDQGACILGIGAITEKNVKRNPVSEFSALITPTKEQWQLASPKALEVNGLTWDRLVAEGKPFAEVREDFLRWLKELSINSNWTYIGQNPNFDLRFLGSYMGAELEFIGFPTKDVIDIRDLYSILANRRAVKFLKYRSGANIADALGVEPEPEIHDALEGARVVRRNYLKLVEMGARS